MASVASVVNEANNAFILFMLFQINQELCNGDLNKAIHYAYIVANDSL